MKGLRTILKSALGSIEDQRVGNEGIRISENPLELRKTHASKPDGTKPEIALLLLIHKMNYPALSQNLI